VVVRLADPHGQRLVAVAGGVLVDRHRCLGGVAGAGLKFGTRRTMLAGDRECGVPQTVDRRVLAAGGLASRGRAGPWRPRPRARAGGAAASGGRAAGRGRTAAAPGLRVLMWRPHSGQARRTDGSVSLSTFRVTLIRPVRSSTSVRRRSSSSPSRRPTKAASTIRSFRRSGIWSTMVCDLAKGRRDHDLFHRNRAGAANLGLGPVDHLPILSRLEDRSQPVRRGIRGRRRRIERASPCLDLRQGHVTERHRPEVRQDPGRQQRVVVAHRRRAQAALVLLSGRDRLARLTAAAYPPSGRSVSRCRPVLCWLPPADPERAKIVIARRAGSQAPEPADAPGRKRHPGDAASGEGASTPRGTTLSRTGFDPSC
jgi:hypothetical protein